MRRGCYHADPRVARWRACVGSCDHAVMSRNLQLCLPLLLVSLAAPLARADEAPDPPKIRQPPPPPPPEPAKVEAPAPVATPAKVETPVPTKTEAPAPAKTETKTDAKQASGGMCRVDATAGAWPLLALLGLGARRRRR